MSGTDEVLGRLLASVRVILREVDGVPLAGDAPSTGSRSIGVEAMTQKEELFAFERLVTNERDLFH